MKKKRFIELTETELNEIYEMWISELWCCKEIEARFNISKYLRRKVIQMKGIENGKEKTN